MSIGASQAVINAKLLAAMSDLTQGSCQSVDWPNSLAVVNIGGANVSVPMFGAAPFPGDAVWIGTLGSKRICLGPLPKATLGAVAAAPVDGMVDVLGDDGVVRNVPYDVQGSYVPESGHRVAMDWAANGVIIARLSSDPTLIEPATPAGPGGGAGGSMTFYPDGSGNWWIDGGSWNKDELWTSNSNKGLWFYGTQIANTIPDGASEVKTQVYVDEYYNQYPSNLARLGTHPHPARPGGAPSVNGAHPVSAGSGWKDLTGTGFFDQLKTGAALGLGTNGIGYHKWSRAGANNSGALYIEWS